METLETIMGNSASERADAAVVFDQLDRIERVVLWLPRNEPRRALLRAGLAETRQAPASSPQARDAILAMRTRVQELRPSSLRTLLLRRVDDLCRMVVFPDREVLARTTISTLAS